MKKRMWKIGTVGKFYGNRQFDRNVRLKYTLD